MVTEKQVEMPLSCFSEAFIQNAFGAGTIEAYIMLLLRCGVQQCCPRCLLFYFSQVIVLMLLLEEKFFRLYLQQFVKIFFLMKIIGWNFQGVNKSRVLQEVEFLTRMYQEDMNFFLKQWLTKATSSVSCPQWATTTLINYVLLNKHSGGIVVFWNNGNINTLVLLKELGAIPMQPCSWAILWKCKIVLFQGYSMP